MKKEIAALLGADALPQLQQSANAFTRIADLNPTEWQPVYYQALAYTFPELQQGTNTRTKGQCTRPEPETLVKKSSRYFTRTTRDRDLARLYDNGKIKRRPRGPRTKLIRRGYEHIWKVIGAGQQKPTHIDPHGTNGIWYRTVLRIIDREGLRARETKFGYI